MKKGQLSSLIMGTATRVSAGVAGSSAMNYLDSNVPFFTKSPVMSPLAVTALGIGLQLFGKGDLMKNAGVGMEVIGGVELAENGIDMVMNKVAPQTAPQQGRGRGYINPEAGNFVS